MSIDLGDTPVGSPPTEEQKTQIRNSLSAFAPVAIGPIAADLDTNLFSIYEDGNLALANYIDSITEIDIPSASGGGRLLLSNLSSLTSFNVYGAVFDELIFDIAGNKSIETMFLDHYGLDVLDLSNCENLTSLNTNYTIISGVNLTGCTSLTSFIGSGVGERDFTPCVALEYIEIKSSLISGVNASGLTNLSEVFFYSNIFDALFSNCTSLETATVTECGGFYDFTGCTSLSTIYASNSSPNVNISGCVSLISITLPSPAMFEEDINAILIELDFNGLENGYVNLENGPAPTGDGITAAANLVTKGWTVITS